MELPEGLLFFVNATSKKINTVSFVSSCSQASFVSGYELIIFVSRQILSIFYISDTVYCAFIKCGLLCVCEGVVA